MKIIGEERDKMHFSFVTEKIMLKFSILLYVLPKLAFYLYLCYTLLCRDKGYSRTTEKYFVERTMVHKARIIH